MLSGIGEFSLTINDCPVSVCISRRQLISSLCKFIQDLRSSKNIASFFLITDSNLKQQVEVLKSNGLDFLSEDNNVLYINPGEESKCRETKAFLEDALFSRGCARDSCLIAFGGGVITDLVGYLAGTFMRGIPYISVPTTLLAMVDASLGGKTGIDIKAGKNLLGLFNDPLAIFISIEWCQTLPQRHWTNGMAEVIKTALLMPEKDLFNLLESNVGALKHRDSLFDPVAMDVAVRVIYNCAHKKASIVALDAKEAGGIRTLLNLGHSIGHAIETLMMPDLLHGEAIAIGLIKELELSHHLGLLDWNIVCRVRSLVNAYGLPTKLPLHLSPDRILDVMKVDKKNRGGLKYVALMEEQIGKMLKNKAVPVQDDDISFVLAQSFVISHCGSSIMEKPSSFVVTVPGSKSISNRALLMAAMGDRPCKLRNLLFSDDTSIMIQALCNLEVCSFSWDSDNEDGDPSCVLTVFPCKKKPMATKSKLDVTIDCGNAGTAARFLTTFCCTINHVNSVILTGNDRMKKRPIKPLVDALQKHGQRIIYLEKEGFFPLQILPQDLFIGGTLDLAANLSSQYVSSILMAAIKAQEEPLTLNLVGEAAVSKPYIEMTLAMMEIFGVSVKVTNDFRTFIIPPKSHFSNPIAYDVECDASSATYPLCIAALTGSSVTVKNLGSKSLQGDSKFAKCVLQPMGCIVEQTDYSTTVKGPSRRNLKGLGRIDMEPMTDAFLSLAAVASFASSETRIYGIDNQRIKECDRISAMHKELSKCGIDVFQDGNELVIRGGATISPDCINSVIPIDCYDDHRVAMSMCVASFGMPEGVKLLIKERFCVDKTWPNFWNFLASTFQKGLLLELPLITSVFPFSQSSETSFVIIGMRRAGKSSLGKFASRTLGYEFIDMDDVFLSEVPGCSSISEFVRDNGWTQFRMLEIKLLDQTLKKLDGRKTIIACGGGIVETKEGMSILEELKNVVFISRSIDDKVFTDQSGSNQRPLFATKSDSEVYAERLGKYQKCANFTFPIMLNDRNWLKLSREFSRFMDWDKRIDFLSIKTFICITRLLKEFDQILEGVDAVELRMDMLYEDIDSVDFESFSLFYASLRRQLGFNRPVIFTIRSVLHGGKFHGNKEKFWSLVNQLFIPLRMDILDVEEEMFDLKNLSGIPNVIISCHDKGQSSKIWFQDKLSKLSTLADSLQPRGKGIMLKVVGGATSAVDYSSLCAIEREAWGYPILQLLMGEYGILGRVTAPFMCPVMHESMVAAAPGQLCLSTLMKLRCQLGLLRKGKVYLIGHPIEKSPSPMIHNKYFRERNVPLTYHRFDCEKKDLLEPLLLAKDFVGASVTIPHKESIVSFVDELDEASSVIGAINTIVRKNNRLYGFNTDYLGIIRTLEEQDWDLTGDILVVGAGGTARATLYALSLMFPDKRCFILNRNKERALSISTIKSNCHVLSDDNKVVDENVTLVIVTIPSHLPIPELVPIACDSKKKCCLDLSYVTESINEELGIIKFRQSEREEYIKSVGWEYVHGYRVLEWQAVYQRDIFLSSN